MSNSNISNSLNVSLDVSIQLSQDNIRKKIVELHQANQRLYQLMQKRECNHEMKFHKAYELVEGISIYKCKLCEAEIVVKNNEV